MSREEIEQKIEEVKNRQFMLQMKDHWSDDDYDTDRMYSCQLRQLKEMLDGKTE